jgi:uncharacterized protein YndB with AHSA1/START domain
MSDTTIKIFEIYIKAPAQTVWEAITTPGWTAKYGYKAALEFDLEPGGAFRGLANEQMRSHGMAEVIIDGEVLEVDAPHKLAQTYRFLFTDDTRAEGFTHVTWEVATTSGGFTRLTLTHDVTGAPLMSGMISSKFSDQGGGGWNWILSDLKTLLETGANL